MKPSVLQAQILASLERKFGMVHPVPEDEPGAEALLGNAGWGALAYHALETDLTFVITRAGDLSVSV